MSAGSIFLMPLPAISHDRSSLHPRHSRRSAQLRDYRHAEFLCLMRIEDDLIVRLDPDCYEVDQLIFPSFAGNIGQTPAWTSQAPRTRLANVLSTTRTPIYVSRKRAERRPVLNEHEVFSKLGDFGFEYAVPHELSVEQQQMDESIL